MERLTAYPPSASHIFHFMNLHEIREHARKTKSDYKERYREEIGSFVAESHYSVMDCTCQRVSVLFILPKHYPRPLSAFPYSSEIYHVKAHATRGMAVRALGCC